MRDINNKARLTMQDRNVDVQEGIRFRSVCRRLFQEEEEIEGGPRRDLNTGNEDNVVNCFFEEARKHREEAKKKWNFDFEKEIPLAGNYQWVKLDRDGNEIPTNAEVRNKTEKMEKNEMDELGQLKEDEVKENKNEENEEEVPPEGKEVDADDKTESRRQKNRSHSRIVDVL
ncbi:PREDICTED: uncharacterized protein LOC106790405 isoform X1 [Polistes canadensis]|uniref:uncharacterized protein LOC106790405 isoform X1 n=2 Tax=Polistes canadensis TaxID=91411 RepID=UPI000718C9ED|nr:PREDICTED: uncharacterized protein LOC106790405 isoform X1 [Polistes canadensis]